MIKHGCGNFCILVGLPVGTFFLGLSIKDGQDIAAEIKVTGDRDETKQGAGRGVISLLGDHLGSK